MRVSSVNLDQGLELLEVLQFASAAYTRMPEGLEHIFRQSRITLKEFSDLLHQLHQPLACSCRFKILRKSAREFGADLLKEFNELLIHGVKKTIEVPEWEKFCLARSLSKRPILGELNRVV